MDSENDDKCQDEGKEECSPVGHTTIINRHIGVILLQLAVEYANLSAVYCRSCGGERGLRSMLRGLSVVLPVMCLKTTIPIRTFRRRLTHV